MRVPFTISTNANAVLSRAAADDLDTQGCRFAVEQQDLNVSTIDGAMFAVHLVCRDGSLGGGLRPRI